MAPQPAAISSERGHFLTGALGAITPALCQLAIVDFRSINLVGPGDVVGWLIRAAICFFIGGLIVHYFYYAERNPARVFYAGLAAPAMIFALANGQKIDPNPAQRTPSQIQQSVSRSVLPPGFWFFSWTVHAADTQSLKTFGPPPDGGFAAQVLRGIVGGVPNNVYFALAGSYPTRDWAEARLPEVRKTFSNAELYGPSGGNNLYSIAIGSHQTSNQAQDLVKRALINLITEAYVWRLGDAGIPPGPAAWADQLGDKRSTDAQAAARVALVQCGSVCIPVIRDVLRDPTSNIVRDRNTLLEQLSTAIAGLADNHVAIPADIKLRMADLYYDRNLFDMALRYFLTVDSSTLDADPDQYCRRGFVRLHSIDLVGAADDYQKCVSLKPKATEVDHRNYGSALVQLGLKAQKSGQSGDAQRYFRSGLDQINIARNNGDDPAHSEAEFKYATAGLGH
jgi:hypothetical protein